MNITTTFQRFNHDFKYVYNRKSKTMGVYIDDILSKMYIGDRAKAMLSALMD